MGATPSSINYYPSFCTFKMGSKSKSLLDKLSKHPSSVAHQVDFLFQTASLYKQGKSSNPYESRLFDMAVYSNHSHDEQLLRRVVEKVRKNVSTCSVWTEVDYCVSSLSSMGSCWHLV